MNNSVVSRISLYAGFITALTLLLPNPAAARVSGEVGIGYEEYSEKTDTSNNSKSSFHHQYSLLFDTRGSFSKGKLGSYGFELGYEWASLDFSGKDNGRDVGTKVTEGHLLYNVQYKYNSKALPLNISLYSQDKNRHSMSSYSFLTDYQGSGSILSSSVIESLSLGGTRVNSGFTLAFGEIKSDPMFSKFPRLAEIPRILIDYREEYVSDLKNFSPQNTRTRWLTTAIGKDSVWLTYNNKEHKDYLSKGNPFEMHGASVNAGSDESSFRIGTVNEKGERLWVDLTNWIKVSADGYMLKINDQGNKTNSVSEYDVNFFATATRERWQARSFNTFSRRIDGYMETEEEFKIPLYVNGAWGSDTSWQVRFEQREDRFTNRWDSGKETVSTASTRVETFKRSPFTLTPSVSVEMSDTNDTKKLLLSGTLQTASTRRFSDRIDIYGSYTISSRNEESSSGTTEQINQSLAGKVTYKLSRNLIVSADQRFTLNSGSTTTEIPAQTTQGDIGTFIAGRTEDANSQFFKSVTTANVGWSPSARMRINAQAAYDLLDTQGAELDTIMTFSGGIDYSIPKGTIGATGRYIQRSAENINSDELALSGYATYSPAQNISSQVRGSFTRANQYGDTSKNTDLMQQITYSIPGRSGRGRFELKQQSQFIQGSETPVHANLYTSVRQFSLQGKYFFNNNIYASALGRYTLLAPGNVSETMGGASLGMDYRLLQGNLEYYQGKRSGANDNRQEKRFSANLKKQF